MTLPYDTGFPVPGDSLGTTQAKFFNNTSSVKSLLNVNHYDFSNTLYGNHKLVIYGRETSNFPNLTGILANAIATYGKSDGTRTQLVFQPSGDSTGAQAIQLTAGDVTNANFGAATNGWTFLPGNLIYQYGFQAAINGNITVTYPLPFPTAVYSVEITPVTDDNTTIRNSILNVSGTASFVISHTDTSHLTGFYWMAIGR
jgi:hypothetical protein